LQKIISQPEINPGTSRFPETSILTTSTTEMVMVVFIATIVIF